MPTDELAVDEWDTLGAILYRSTTTNFQQTRTELYAALAAGEVSVTDCLLGIDEAITLALSELDQLTEVMATPPSADWSAALDQGRKLFHDGRAQYREVLLDFRPFEPLTEQVGAFTRSEAPKSDAQFFQFMDDVAELKRLQASHAGPARSTVDAFLRGVDEWISELDIEVRFEDDGPR